MDLNILDKFMYEILDELETSIEQNIISNIDNEDEQNEALIDLGDRIEDLKDQYEQIKWES